MVSGYLEVVDRPLALAGGGKMVAQYRRHLHQRSAEAVSSPQAARAWSWRR